jgi:L-amino acid N-acyltransferase YncA
VSTTIRRATEHDAAAIASITNHYIQHTTIHFGETPVSADELAAAIAADRAVHPWLVTVADAGSSTGDGVLGYAKAGVFRQRAAYRWTTETGIYLRPDCCGRGLGQPLYERLLELLRQQGFRTVIGGIALPNDTSVRLHERLGFRHAGTINRAGFKHGRWHDIGFWQLHFADDSPPL